MAFDGAFIHKLTQELNILCGARVDKIYQPSPFHTVLLFRKTGMEPKRLLISVHSGSSGVYFIDDRPENPQNPPMFCMLLRKYLCGGKLLEISQKGLERVITLKFSTYNEMGDMIYPELAVELIGAAPNMILLCDGKIIDAVKRSSLENGDRIIQSGAIYEMPPSLNKINPLETGTDDIVGKIINCGNIPLDRAILNTIDGFSPLLSRELSHRTGADLFADSLTEYHKNTLKKEIENIKNEIISGGEPTMITDESGAPFEFSFIQITQYGKKFGNTVYGSYSKLAEDFYRKKFTSERLHRELSEILKLLTNLNSRINRRINIRKIDLKKCENREKLRIYGELIKANIHNISAGQTSLKAVNFYDENLNEITVPLNPALSPAANATKYFKDYKKTYSAEQTLSKLILQDETELEYIDSVFDSLSRAESTSDIAEIKTELAAAGYIKKQNSNKKIKENNTLKEYETKSGIKIYVGKNNRQNDLLTTKFAAKTDLWFHTKNVPGSHTILVCSGKEVTDDDIIFAATLAAQNSKAASSSNVAVDYTYVKNVKKPSGAKPGMVIYTTYSTVFVNPYKK